MYQIFFSEIQTDKIQKQDYIKLEILPEKLTCSGGREVKIHNMLAIGEVSKPGRRKLRTWQINSVLESDGEKTVEFYRNLFQHLSETQVPFYLTIVRENADGSNTFGDQMHVVLEDCDFEEREGEMGTLYYKIKLREYVKFEAKKENVNGQDFVRITPSVMQKKGWTNE